MRRLVLAVVLIAGCGRAPEQIELSIDDAGPADGGVLTAEDAGAPAMPECSTVARSCDAVIASFVTEIEGLTVDCDEARGIFTLASTGVPNYPSNQSTPNSILDQMWIVDFPLNPTCSDTPIDVIDSRGPVGFMINGVPFYGPQNATGGDAVLLEARTFDDCDGHADPRCSYHYHGEPVCIASQPEPDGHAELIGYALDGFALYGSTPSPGSGSLDDCHGHSDATRGYHYHAAPTFPYLMACYRGASTANVAGVPACRR